MTVRYLPKVSAIQFLQGVKESQYSNQVWTWSRNRNGDVRDHVIAVGSSALVEVYGNGLVRVSGNNLALVNAIRQNISSNSSNNWHLISRKLEKIASDVLLTKDVVLFGMIAFDDFNAQMHAVCRSDRVAIFWLPSALCEDVGKKGLSVTVLDNTLAIDMNEIVSSSQSRNTKPVLPKLILQPSMTKAEFINAAKVASDFLRSGDAYQIQIGYEYYGEFKDSIFPFFEQVWENVPSSHMFYAAISDLEIVSASPEYVIQISGPSISMRPLAGSIPKEGAGCAQKLRSSVKEQAEHLMLVDLCRNDISRVAIPGTVQVPELARIEELPNVLHLASRINGRLRTGKDKWDALLSCFPAGTVVGAPKVRAMEIISELEVSPRCFYGGAAFATFSGDQLDTTLIIRTAIRYGGTVALRAAAGIVADSDLNQEWHEVEIKLSKLLTMFTGGE